MSPRAVATILVLESSWEKTGDEEDPASRLLATLVVNGVSFHLEAFRVTDLENGQRPAEGLTESFNDWARAASPDGPFETVSIFDADYVIFASPYC